MHKGTPTNPSLLTTLTPEGRKQIKPIEISVMFHIRKANNLTVGNLVQYFISILVMLQFIHFCPDSYGAQI